MNARDRSNWLRPSPPIPVDDEPPAARGAEQPGDAESLQSGDSDEERETD